MPAVALQRTKAYLEEKGWHTWIVEHFNQWAHVRQDLYGFADIVGIRHDFKGVWAINACDEGRVLEHCRKYLDGFDHPKKGRQPANPHLPVWLSGGNRFTIMEWRKVCRDGRGTRKEWQPRLIEMYLDGAEVKWKELQIETENAEVR